MRILVLGATGMLGSDLVPLLNSYDVIPAGSKDINIAEKDCIKKIADIKPDFIYLLAAYTNVEKCEDEVEKAFMVNAIGVRNVCIAAQKLNCPLLYISTDYVFDGKKDEPYYEFDKPNPLSVYGRSKYWGEVFVRDLLNKFFIVRTSWLYGKNGINFVYKMLEISKKNKVLKVVNDQTGSPTYTKDLAEALTLFLNCEFYGIYHITNSGYCTWYEFAKKIFEIKGIDVEVIPVSSAEFPAKARRPKNSRLSNFHFEKTFGRKLRHWHDALKDFLNNF